jgi:hypothetical protein
MTTSPWQPYREPLRTTLLRTGAIALVIAVALSRGRVNRLPIATLLALWPAFGGHWLELFFLNYLRPRLPIARPVQIAARILVWFIGGVLLTLGMQLTATAIARAGWPARAPVWWIGGIGFIGVELITHLALQLRGLASFYNGRG